MPNRSGDASARELGSELDELRALTANLFASQEKERRRVARELHDNISQKLAVLEIDVQQIEPSGGAARDELARVRVAIATLSQDLRRISRSLYPSVIDDLGLQPAIRSLVQDFRDHEQMVVKFESPNSLDEIPVNIATGLYRIAEEALHNVVKHAGKTQVEVLLEGGSGTVRLRLTDRGEGFDLQTSHRGLGLIAMKERARMMRATFAIESRPGQGTTVTVEAPLR